MGASLPLDEIAAHTVEAKAQAQHPNAQAEHQRQCQRRPVGQAVQFPVKEKSRAEHGHGVVILVPRTGVVAHLIAQQLLQREPGVAGTLANAAVGDDGTPAVDAYARIQLTQLFHRRGGAIRSKARSRHRVRDRHARSMTREWWWARKEVIALVKSTEVSIAAL